MHGQAAPVAPAQPGRVISSSVGVGRGGGVMRATATCSALAYGLGSALGEGFVQQLVHLTRGLCRSLFLPVAQLLLAAAQCLLLFGELALFTVQRCALGIDLRALGGERRAL